MKGGDAGIAYSVCGGVAVCLHGYQRNTTDLNLIIRSENSDSVRPVLTETGFTWETLKAEFRTVDGIAIRFLIAGHKAGKGTEVSVSESLLRLFATIVQRIFETLIDDDQHLV